VRAVTFVRGSDFEISSECSLSNEARARWRGVDVDRGQVAMARILTVVRVEIDL